MQARTKEIKHCFDCKYVYCTTSIYIIDCVKYIVLNKVFYKQMQVNHIHVSTVQIESFDI